MLISYAFLAFALWCAMFTVLALWTPRRPGFLVPVVFFAAWLAGELAIWHIVWQLALTVVFVAFGALDAWPGDVALVIMCVSWAGLVVGLVAASRTDRVFEAAFERELGEDWRDAIDPAWAAERVGIDWLHMVAGIRNRRRRPVERVRDIAYVDDGRRRHRLDVWRCDGAGPAAPVLLQIHGGGWMVGSKDQQARPLLHQLAARGWVCVSINYRLSPRATWPDHLVDCKLALKWVREYIAGYGGDPDYVVVTGGSAGGHLAAMMGLTANRPEFQPGFEDVDTRVRAMVPFYGVFDFQDRHGFRGNSGGAAFRRVARRHILKADPAENPEVYALASPLDQIHPDAPAALVVHGELDVLAPVEEARVFADLLRETSREPVVYVELARAQHAFEMFHSIRGLYTVAAVEAFLAWVLSRDGKSSTASSGSTS